MAVTHPRSEVINEIGRDESTRCCLIFPAGISRGREVVGQGYKNGANCLTSAVPRGLKKPVMGSLNPESPYVRAYRTVADHRSIRVQRNRSVAGIAVAGNFAEAVLQNEVTLRCKDTPTHKLSKSGQRTRSKYGEPKANPILSHCWMWRKRQSF